MKRCLSLLLALLLCFSCALSEGENRIDAGVLPDFVPQLLAVAQNELGYVEGGNNYSKYGEWSGDPNAAWCAEFICWCVAQLDQQQGSQLLTTVYPRYSGQNTGRDWFIRRGRFVYRKGYCPDWGYQWMKGSDHYLTKNEYIPRPGDLMFFSYNAEGDTEHVALVEYCTRDEFGEVYVHVIEGNNPDRVQRKSYPLDNSQVLGFGLCEDLADTTLRFGNEGDKVLDLQIILCEMGLLDERHKTGIYGNNTRDAVSEFQKQHLPHRTPAGVADRETQQMIQTVYNQWILESPDTWLVTD
ncbi:MAG: CHAP domain-containing protein [Clostridia bacterium]|nr:CHAP domain-containing protein [Clostridia bacterium]